VGEKDEGCGAVTSISQPLLCICPDIQCRAYESMSGSVTAENFGLSSFNDTVLPKSVQPLVTHTHAHITVPLHAMEALGGKEV